MKEKKLTIEKIQQSLTKGLNAIWNVMKNFHFSSPVDKIAHKKTFISANGPPKINPLPGKESKKS
jgi:hypothetical protein